MKGVRISSLCVSHNHWHPKVLLVSTLLVLWQPDKMFILQPKDYTCTTAGLCLIFRSWTASKVAGSGYAVIPRS